MKWRILMNLSCDGMKTLNASFGTKTFDTREDAIAAIRGIGFEPTEYIRADNGFDDVIHVSLDVWGE